MCALQRLRPSVKVSCAPVPQGLCVLVSAVRSAALDYKALLVRQGRM